jgi:hypothetical protein
VQYTAASYAQLPLAAAVPGALRPRRIGALPLPATGSGRAEGDGGFPAPSRFALESDDPARARVFEPAFRRVGDTFARLRRFQQARLNLQLLYTLVTVLVLSALLLLHRGSR